MAKSTKGAADTSVQPTTKRSWEKRLAKVAAGLVLVILATYGLHQFLMAQAVKTSAQYVYDALTVVIMSLLLYVLHED